MKREVTNSELSTFQHCPQRWWFKYGQLLSPQKEHEYLSFGKIVHEAFRLLYEKKEIQIINDYIANEFSKNMLLTEDEELQNEIDNDCALAIGMMQRYAEYAKIHDDFEIVEMETEHTVSIAAPSGRASTVFAYTFRPDQVLKRNARIWLHELKTAESIDQNYIENLVLDEQMSRYCWSYEKKTGQEVQGVIYTILRKKLPAIPELLKNGELTKRANIDTTHEIYLNAIKQHSLNPLNYSDILDTLKAKGETFIRREIVLRNQKEKLDCERRLWTLCKTINVDPPIYKCPSRDCSWKCEFRTLCIEDSPEARSTYNVRENYHPELYREEKGAVING